MVKMLVLSDRLLQEGAMKQSFGKDVELYPWIVFPNIPRLSDYEIAVLDMQIPESNDCKGAFLGLKNEVNTLFDSGGVVICLNYFTVTTPFKVKCVSDYDYPAIVRAGIVTRFEINYDWIPLNLLYRTGIADLEAKIGKHFDILSRDKNILEYFKGVDEYHKTVDSVELEHDKKGNLLRYYLLIDDQSRPSLRPFAVSKVSRQPIACQIDISEGSLVFLPQSKLEPTTVIAQLFEIGKSEYQGGLNRADKTQLPPDWLHKYKTEQELDLEKEIGELEERLEQNRDELERFNQIDLLLYGTGSALENAVQRTLEEMSFDVQKTEKGATIDFKVKIDSAKFAIEVTGVDGEILKDNKKFGQILSYLPNKEDDEKIILLANTHRMTDLTERSKKESFTLPVQKLAKDNHFCLMTTADLFLIWKDSLNGKSTKKAIATILKAEGEYKYDKP